MFSQVCQHEGVKSFLPGIVPGTEFNIVFLQSWSLHPELFEQHWVNLEDLILSKNEREDTKQILKILSRELYS